MAFGQLVLCMVSSIQTSGLGLTEQLDSEPRMLSREAFLVTILVVHCLFNCSRIYYDFSPSIFTHVILH